MSGRILRWLAALAIGVGFVAAPDGVRSDEKKTAGKQQAKHFEGSDGKVKLNYLLYLPEGYGEGEKVWPLVLFLHGAGESGDNLEKVKIHGPPKMIAAGKSFPCIVVSPQSPSRGWKPEGLNALLDDVVAKYKVDKDRICVTGLSMGGFGTWALAAAHPERFAALVPICGGGNPTDAAKLKDLPIWVFHGAKDRAVPPGRSEAMVKALKEAGAKNVQLTMYPDAGHDSWTATYNNPEMWEWLFKQKRSGGQKK
ncbi:MAG TPA: prolyl oligopeptidase family serine peptidase [Gemmataceae bacterium]